MSNPTFHYYPEKWGMQMHYTGKPVPLKESDLELLGRLREHFKEEKGSILSWKFDLKPIQNVFPGMIHALHRLWANGLVVRFSSQFHTVHGNPEYIKWLIWEEFDEQTALEGSDTGTISYLVQR